MRVGIGYDVHRLTEGRDLILGGVNLPFPRGLEGHSDADVLVHALGDALLGAAGAGDIGRHFPDTDDQYRGISSLLLLERVGKIINECGYEIINADVVVILQRPRLAEHIPQMEDNLARVLELEAGKINIKATTNEKLGMIGREEGIAALATASLREREA